MNRWLRENKIEVTILLVMALILNAFVYWQTKGATIAFQDTDDYMQLVRIRDFFHHHDWFNNVIDRCNVPFGGELHWTRFYDLFLIVPSYILSFFTNSINDAIEYVGFCISPIVQAVSIVFFLHFAQFLMTKRRAFVCSAVFVSNPLILPYETFGRPDHHAFILMFVLIFLANLRNIGDVFDHNVGHEEGDSSATYRKHAIKMSFITALGVWLSPELLILFLTTDAVLYLWWLLGSDEGDCFIGQPLLRYICIKNATTAFLIYIILFLEIHERLAVQLALLFFFQIAMKFYDGRHHQLPGNTSNEIAIAQIVVLLGLLLTITLCAFVNNVKYDSISFVHLVLYLLSAVFFWICSNYCSSYGLRSRIIKCFCYFALLLTLFLLLYEKFFFGPAADVSDYLKKIWMSRVLEMKSPFQLGYGILFVINGIVELAAIGLKILDLVSIWKTSDRPKIFPKRVLVESIVIANALCYLLLAAFAWRMMPYAMLLGILLTVWLIMDYDGKSCPPLKIFLRKLHQKIFLYAPKIQLKIFAGKTNWFRKLFQSQSKSSLPRLVAAAFLVPLMVFMGAPREDSEDEDKAQNQEKTYKEKELFAAVDNISSTSLVLMAHCDFGPQLLYYTKHKVVGAPYHRQHQGISASYEVMEAPFSPQKVKKILAATDASYIFIKKSPNKRKKNDKHHKNNSPSLTEMIIAGQLPSWISIENFPKKFNDVIIAKIHRDLLTIK